MGPGRRARRPDRLGIPRLDERVPNRFRRSTLGLRRAISLAAPATDELAAVETRDEVVRLLRELNRRQRAAVLLTAILDYSAEEAGRMLGMRAYSVRSLTTRARARMKDKVAPT